MQESNVKYRPLSGANIEREMILERSTYLSLYRKIKNGFPYTKKRQHLQSTVTVQQATYVPYPENGKLLIKTNTRTSNGDAYEQQIMLSNVVFEGPTQIPGTEQQMEPVKLTSAYVQVHCTCLDFYWRFAKHNAGDDSLVGDPPPPYKPKTNRVVNPRRVAGVCKHLIATFNYIKRNKIVR